jgi:hypothetical protein
MSLMLTDKQVDHITNVLRPLLATERKEMTAALLEALLMRRDEIGDGSLGRMLRDLQRQHFRPQPKRRTPGKVRGSVISRPAPDPS